MFNNLTPFEILKNSINNEDFFQVFPHQEEVLEKYNFEYKEKSNLAIEMPTGSGKSFILLAIAQYWLQQDKKVCVLAPNNQLCKQLKKESDRLKFSSVTIHRKNSEQSDANSNLRKYNFKEAFGITNYARFFTHEIEADVVIFDDSHLLDDYLENRFTIKLYWENEISQKTKEFLIKNEILSEEEFLNISKENNVKLLNFVDETKVIEFIKQELIKLKSEDGDLFWDYYNNKTYLDNYLIFISNEGIFITPFVKNLNLLKQVSNVPKKIFLSATIPSRNQFILSVGITEEPAILRYLSLNNSDYNKLTMGNRLILPKPNLMNIDLENPRAELHSRIASETIDIISKFKKSVILCRSFSELNFYKSKIESILGLSKKIFTSQEDNFYDDFLASDNAVLLLANRYSGLDFPNDTCNVLVLTSIPSRCTPIEIFKEDELKDKPYSEEKTAIRIVQAFGRCNRNKKDTGIYFVLDGGFYFTFNKQSEYAKYYPPNILNEINQGVELYEQHNKDLGKLIEISSKYLENPEILDLRRIQSNKNPYDDESTLNTKLVHIWKLMLNGNYNDSKHIISHIIRKEQISQEYKTWFYYLVARCDYRLNGNNVNQNVLNSLQESTREHHTPFFNNLFKTYASLNKQNDIKTPTYQHFHKKASLLVKNQTETFQKLMPIKTNLDSEEHDKICLGIEKLFKLFDINIENISKKSANMDLKIKDINLNKGYFIEVKSKPEAKSISSSDIGQIKKHIGSDVEKEFSDTKLILLTKKELNIEDDAQDKMANLFRHNIEDYVKLIEQLMTSLNDIDKFTNLIHKFYNDNFENL